MFEEPEDQASRGLEDYWAVVGRRRWWILLPLFVCWAVVWGLSRVLPAVYQSEALILVEQQKVPEQYVVPNVSVSLQDRLQSMTQQILSRTRLQQTINRFHLYSSHHSLSGLMQLEDPVEQMRKDIQIELVAPPGRPGELTAFKIRYSAGSRELAQQVNSELTSLFIEENLKSQQQLSESTTAFLDNQLADARAKLEEQENKVRAFKAKHFGDLPSQLASNVEILSGLQAQLQSTQRALDMANQQRLYLESLLQQYQSVQASLGAGGSTVTSPQALAKELTDLRIHLEDERSIYTDDHPDVIALKDKIAKTEKLKKEIEDEIASNQKTSKVGNPFGPDAAEQVQHGSPTSMMQIQSQLTANQLEIHNDQQHEKDLESQISAYQVRLNMTPETEQELADVSRGYEESKSNYNSLLQKQMQSQLATSLEQRQQGEQFRIIDPPSLPDKPTSPNHFLLSLGGLVLGIALGVALTLFLEVTDVCIRQEKDLEGVVSAGILVSIPRLSTPPEERLRVMAGWMELGAAVAIVVLIVAGNLYAFYKG
jgi:polysaccharide biosynthesis transport protein